MKQERVFFHPIEGSGQLGISWSPGPKGDAIEAKVGAGIGFFSPEGSLLSVIFDEVNATEDHQVLEFPDCRIEIEVRKGKVDYKLLKKRPLAKQRKNPPRKRLSIKTKR